MTGRHAITLLTGAVILWIAGCNSSPVRLTLPKTPPQAVAAPQTPANAFQVTFAPTVDSRPAYQQPNVGSVGGREVVADKLTDWIDRSFRSLHGKSFVVREKADANTWLVTPRILQFYTASVAISKNANVVLELQIQPPAGPAFTRVYRGRVNAMNWWNSSAEIEGSIVDSLGDCLEHIAHDLDSLSQPNSAPTVADNAHQT